MPGGYDPSGAPYKSRSTPARPEMVGVEATEARHVQQ